MKTDILVFGLIYNRDMTTSVGFLLNSYTLVLTEIGYMADCVVFLIRMTMCGRIDKMEVRMYEKSARVY